MLVPCNDFLLLLGRRLDAFEELEGLIDSSIGFDEDLGMFSSCLSQIFGEAHPVLFDIVEFVFLPLRRDGGGGGVIREGGSGSVTLRRLFRFRGAGSVSSSESAGLGSRRPDAFRFRVVGGGGGSAKSEEGSAASLAEERVTLEDMRTYFSDVVGIR